MKASPTKRSNVFNKTDGHCAYCGKELDPFKGWAIDHAIPQAQDGPNDLWNLYPACRRCNSRKRDKTVEEYAAWYVYTVAEHIRQAILELGSEPKIVFFGQPANDQENMFLNMLNELYLNSAIIEHSDVRFYADEQFRAANLRYQRYRGQQNE